MLNIALFEPQIPPNTGNIIRLAANMAARLHLIKPYGFELSDKRLRRAGLDYAITELYEYDSFADFGVWFSGKRLFVVSTKATTTYSQPRYRDEDIFLFGSETKGLPASIRQSFSAIRLPMADGCRSLNLSNSVAIVLYEAWRQLEHADLG